MRVKLTARQMAQVKERGGDGEEKALVSFLARSKPKISFIGLSLLRNQTETLATQARLVMTQLFLADP